MRELNDLEKELPIYVVMNDGEAVYASLDEDFAEAQYQKLELENIRLAEDNLGMKEEDNPLAVGFEAGYNGDHNYIVTINDGFNYFENEDDFETDEGDLITQYDIEQCLDVGEDEDFDPLDFSDSEDFE